MSGGVAVKKYVPPSRSAVEHRGQYHPLPQVVLTSTASRSIVRRVRGLVYKGACEF